jgi:glycogen operon protein
VLLVVRGEVGEREPVVRGHEVDGCERPARRVEYALGPGEAPPDIAWFCRDGTEMTDAQWEAADDHVLTVFLNGELLEPDRRGEPVVDDRLLVVLNGDPDTCEVVLPPAAFAEAWCLDLDTTVVSVDPDRDPIGAGAPLEVTGRSVLVLRGLPSSADG